MKIFKKTSLCILLALVLATLGLFYYFNASLTSNADTAIEQEEGDIQPRGVYTKLVLSIDGANGEVWAKVKNNISIFPSTVYVVVQIYSSETYQDSYLNMTLEKQNSTNDLNMGKSITASASTNGIKRYWKARMYYKIDSNSWKEKVTDTFLFGGDGIVIM